MQIDKEQIITILSEPDSDLFTVNGEPVKFYLWGTNASDEKPGVLSEGQRDALRSNILVSPHFFVIAFLV